jgi:hypothetical protein
LLGHFATSAHVFGASLGVVLLGGAGGSGGGEDSMVDFGVLMGCGSGGAENTRHLGEESLPWSETKSFSREVSWW